MIVMDTIGDTAQAAQDRAQHFKQAIGALELAHAFLGAAIQSLRWTPQDTATVAQAFHIFDQHMNEARKSLHHFTALLWWRDNGRDGGYGNADGSPSDNGPGVW